MNSSQVGTRAEDPSRDVARERLKTGRNEPCPCGSGRKYKKCCLFSDEALVSQVKAAPPAPVPARAGLSEETQKDSLVQERGPKPREPNPVRDKLDSIWDAFEALKEPSRAQMDQFLEDLLRLAHEAVDWSDAMHELAERGHPDLDAVFSRIADTVEHDKKTGIASFYWAAAEEFNQHGLAHLLPKLARGFCKLDVHSYDPDALSFIEGYLLAAGYEEETLRLAEHFLPIVREDTNLMGWAVPEHCVLIFDLRVGIALRTYPAAQLSADVLKTVEQDLKRDFEGELDAQLISHAAAVICDPRPLAELLTPELLEFRYTKNVDDDPAAWQEFLRLHGVLIRVAREAWQNEGIAPGRAFRGLERVLQSIYAEDEDSVRKRRKQRRRKNQDKDLTRNTLLEYLHPAGIDGRVARSCAMLMGTNAALAHVQLDGYEVLRRFAVRHGLISTDEAAATEKELARLREILGIQ